MVGVEPRALYIGQGVEIPIPNRTRLRPSSQIDRKVLALVEQHWVSLCDSTLVGLLRWTPSNILAPENLVTERLAEQLDLSKHNIRTTVLELDPRQISRFPLGNDASAEAPRFAYRYYALTSEHGPAHDPHVLITRLGLIQLRAIVLGHNLESAMPGYTRLLLTPNRTLDDAEEIDLREKLLKVYRDSSKLPTLARQITD